MQGPASGKVCTCLTRLICIRIQTGTPSRECVGAMGVDVAKKKKKKKFSEN